MQEIRRFKSLEACLKEIKKFIKATAKEGKKQHHLETGEGFKNFGNIRSREILGNWLLCAVLNQGQENHERMKLCTDTDGGDGMIFDTKENHAFYTEHVMISSWGEADSDIEKLVIDQIKKKQAKGKEYARGKTLVVFINRPGSGWSPNRIMRKLPVDFNFSSLWIFSLRDEINSVYTYNVAELNEMPTSVWEIVIDKSFSRWNINKVQ